jgi:hypothetical protein
LGKELLNKKKYEECFFHGRSFGKKIAFSIMIDEIYEKKANNMTTNSKITAGLYVVICSITVLVMLTTSFEMFNGKYFPSFMLAQKYALPLIISAMAIVFLTFFEPERLSQKSTLTVMRTLMVLTLAIFTFYMTTLDMTQTSTGTLIIFILQWAATLFETVYFFLLKNSEAALHAK